MSDWQQIQQVFLLSADLQGDEREHVLEELCGSDAELRREVESLLTADSGSAATIDAAIQDIAATVLDTPVLIGERLGVYRIEREIGRGGIGSVYLALRDDDEYTREVALKVVKRGMHTEEVLRRFREERQILANLDHPYIARLFDGGTTADGIPYFAMEYVEGRPVDVFCREEALDFKARCRLFLNILEAVSYAHRNIVVHGDLKPANIFITPDGVPKLLDFGVAKLIGREGDIDASARAFTPGYASPEQVHGTKISTATDVYSLGAVLYELLSGQRYLPGNRESSDRSVSSIPVDLNCIAQKALSEETASRYQSAEQFADDIRRYLDGCPVTARANTFAYRTSKFLMRNRVQAALVAAIVAALIGGLVVSLAETHRALAERAVAEAQRQIAVHERTEAEAARQDETKQRGLADEQRRVAEKERDEAQRQRAIADQRLKDIMQLAERTLFDAHTAIASLPGSIPARKKIVETTLAYLESMSGKIGENDELREALTAAYYKVSLIQGDPHGASLGDTAGAEKSLLKAQEILLPAYRRHPEDGGLMMRWIEVRSGLADAASRSGRARDGVRIYLDLLPVTRRVAHAKDCAMDCEMQEGAIENAIALLLNTVYPKQALEHAERAIELGHITIARHPDNLEAKRSLGVVIGVAASGYKAMGNLEKSADYYRQAVEMREQSLRDDPSNLFIRRNLLVAYGNYVLLLGVPWSQNLDRPDEARAYAQKGVAIARQTVKEDPQDATARRDLGMILGRLGMIDPAPGETAASLASLDESASLLAPLAEKNPDSYEAASQLAQVVEYQGVRLAELGKTTEAAEKYHKSMALFEPFLHQPTLHMAPDYIADQEGLALLGASTGDYAGAIEMAHKAIASGEEYVAAPPPGDNRVAALAGAWADLAVVQSKAGHNEEARQAAEKAIQISDSIQQRGILTAYRKPMAAAHAIVTAAR